MTDQKPRRHPLLPEGYGLGAKDSMPRAVVYMLLSSASFAGMAAMVKAAGTLPVHEKVFFRNLVTLVITLVMAGRHRENPFGPTPHLKLLLTRAVCGLGGVLLYFYAIGNLTLADASMLNKISPFFVTIFAALWLGEKLTRRIVAGVAVAFVGAILVIRPGMHLQLLPALAGLGSAFFAALAYTVVRKLKGKARPRRIVFYFSLVSTVAMIPPLLWHHVMPLGWQWLWLLGTGVFAASGQVFLTMAYHHAPAAQISIWGYNHVLFALLVGLAVWGERPDIISIAGGVLILAAALMNRHTR